MYYVGNNFIKIKYLIMMCNGLCEIILHKKWILFNNIAIIIMQCGIES